MYAVHIQVLQDSLANSKPSLIKKKHFQINIIYTRWKKVKLQHHYFAIGQTHLKQFSIGWTELEVKTIKIFGRGQFTTFSDWFKRWRLINIHETCLLHVLILKKICQDDLIGLKEAATLSICYRVHSDNRAKSMLQDASDYCLLPSGSCCIRVAGVPFWKESFFNTGCIKCAF